MKTTNSVIMNIKKLRILLLLACLAITPMAMAGEASTEEDIKHEISFLAAKLLEMSGEESYTVESPASLKPFIGICTSISEAGIAITCVTPGSQAEKGGLVTGDIVTEMNKLSLLNSEEMKTKEAYYGIVKAMKVGDVINVVVQREDKTLPLALTVGSVDHPAFSCKITK